MTINSLVNFGVPGVSLSPRVSPSAVQMAQEIVGEWALGDAPAAMTLGDIRKLTAQIAAGLERYYQQELERDRAVERMQEVS